jgi:hypothetical protein
VAGGAGALEGAAEVAAAAAGAAVAAGPAAAAEAAGLAASHLSLHPELHGLQRHMAVGADGLQLFPLDRCSRDGRKEGALGMRCSAVGEFASCTSRATLINFPVGLMEAVILDILAGASSGGHFHLYIFSALP